MKNPPILGLIGPLGCGKTATALAIGHKRMSCASLIRDMLVALGVDREATTNRKNEPISWLNNKTPRSLLRTLGTEWGRAYVGPDIWISSVLRQLRGTGEPVVIDDIRFDNEAQAVKAAGGYLVYLARPGCSYSYEHESECGLTDWSIVDGYMSMATGTMLSNEQASQLFPRRPWWANYRAGRWLIRQIRRVNPVNHELGYCVEPAVIGRQIHTQWMHMVKINAAFNAALNRALSK